jgi:hypothetical protein
LIEDADKSTLLQNYTSCITPEIIVWCIMFVFKYVTNWLTPWSWVLQKPPVAQPLNFPTFYGTRRIITAFKGALYSSLSWVRSVLSIRPHPISVISFYRIEICSVSLLFTISSTFFFCIYEMWFDFHVDLRCTNSSVGIATGWGSIPGKGNILLFTVASIPAQGPTQPSIQWVRGIISPGVKRPGREADYSPPSSAEVKNCGAIPPLPHVSSWNIA